MKVLLVIALFAVGAIAQQRCPDGGEIYEWGISEAGKNSIVNAHNKYRQMILNGQVPNQPRGKDIKMMHFDDNLAREGRKVSKTCRMRHVIGKDSRFGYVGQNLYISWSSRRNTQQNWEAAAASWFNEHKDFEYPNTSHGITGHYTQVVWHNSEFLGCDYIAYYDKNRSRTPYAQLYTCNYGPGGNIGSQAPYERA